jgi:hypothetical protein
MLSISPRHWGLRQASLVRGRGRAIASEKSKTAEAKINNAQAKGRCENMHLYSFGAIGMRHNVLHFNTEGLLLVCAADLIDSDSSRLIATRSVLSLAWVSSMHMGRESNNRSGLGC